MGSFSCVNGTASYLNGRRVMKRSLNTGLLVSLVVLILIGASGYFVWRKLDQGIEELNQAKASRHTTATVMRKEYVKFDQLNHSYVSDLGDVIEMSPGTERWRVYYRIKNFDQVPEPKRSELTASEQVRIAKYGDRFYHWVLKEKRFFSPWKQVTR
ncbi:MAG: hypothetical protein QOD75_3909 [Blastocatellia bacterium]|jgi:hypothetical protein|nr:hypothetical protein [Blastocatellia bacterium]